MFVEILSFFPDDVYVGHASYVDMGGAEISTGFHWFFTGGTKCPVVFTPDSNSLD